MPYPPIYPVVPLSKYLLQPLHDRRQRQPIRRLNVERQPIVYNMQPANLKGKPKRGLLEHPGKQGHGLTPAEQGFPVVDLGTDFVPHPLFQYT
jgi:hypothetical protein